MSANPSEDELAQHWSLSPEDLAEISQCRGADHKRRYALQLCMLRTRGRFLDDYREASLRVRLESAHERAIRRVSSMTDAA